MALNTPYKRVDLNVNPNYVSMAQKDPWFALGYALGEGYWNNYNERGIKKGTDKAIERLGEYPNSSQSAPAPQDIIDQAMTLSVGGNTVKADSVKKAGEKGKDDGATTIKPELDHSMLKWGYTLDKYKDEPNPVGDSISAKNVVRDTGKALVNTDMGVFDDAKFYANLRKELTLDGRNSRQIDAILANIKPMVDSRKAEFNRGKVSELLEAHKLAFEQGDYAQAERYGLEAVKYDPTIANYLLGKENARYKGEIAEAKAQKDFNRKVTLASSGIGGTNSKGLTAMVNSAKAIMADRENFLKNNPGAKPEDYPYANEYEAGVDFLSSLYGYKGQSKEKTVTYDGLKSKYKNLYSETDEATVLRAIKNDPDARAFFDENPDIVSKFTKETGIMFPFKSK